MADMDVTIPLECIGAMEGGAEMWDGCEREALADAISNGKDTGEAMEAQAASAALCSAIRTSDRPEGELQVAMPASLAGLVARTALTQVAYDLADKTERLGYGPADYRRAASMIAWLVELAERAETAQVEAIMGSSDEPEAS